MLDLSNLLTNPLTRNLVFGKLKTAMREGGLTLLTVKMDEKEEIIFDAFDVPVRVISEADFKTLEQSFLKTL